MVTCGDLIFTDGHTTICCGNAASSSVDVDSLGLMPQENGEGMSTCFCEDRFAVSAGDAKRSGYDEIYNLNEALLSELCCTFLCDQSIQESPELRAFEEEWCFLEKEEIEDGI